MGEQGESKWESKGAGSVRMGRGLWGKEERGEEGSRCYGRIVNA
jgi:hypothetical protein